MNYYYSDGGGNTFGPYPKEDLLELRNEGVITDQTLVCEEGAQQWYPLSSFFPLSSIPPMPKPSLSQRTVLAPPNVSAFANRSTGVVSGKAIRRAYLERLRAESCYPVLRAVISIVTVLSILWVLGGALLIAVGANSIGDIRGEGANYAVLVSIGGAIIASVLIIASRQAALLVVDLADTQIDRNSQG